MANVRLGVLAVESGKLGTTYSESWLAKEQVMAAAWVEKWGQVNSQAFLIACMVPSSMCACNMYDTPALIWAAPADT